MKVRDVGAFIRDRRVDAKLSLRKAASLAGVSIPYLSQIERGLRRPSADILQAIAKGLSISAETLYVQAGILEDRPPVDVPSAILSDASINERQKHALLQIYAAFREEAASDEPEAPPRTATKPRPKRAATPRPRTKPHPVRKATA